MKTQLVCAHSNAAQSSGSSVTTWGNGTQDQTLPAYVGVQEIDSSSNWVYIRTTGLGIHVMGAWQAGFPNLPPGEGGTGEGRGEGLLSLIFNFPVFNF